MENTFADINWSSVGIDLSLEKTLENPMIEHKPVHHGPKVQPVSKPKTTKRVYSSMYKAMWVSFITIVIAIILVSFMARNADAGMAFMRFTVFEVTDTTIIVYDDHEDFFTFYKEGSPDVKKGDEVMVCTDIRFAGSDMWVWDRSRTAIIEVKE